MAYKGLKQKQVANLKEIKTDHRKVIRWERLHELTDTLKKRNISLGKFTL